jgi:hypothetical protein
MRQGFGIPSQTAQRPVAVLVQPDFLPNIQFLQIWQVDLLAAFYPISFLDS